MYFLSYRVKFLGVPINLALRSYTRYVLRKYSNIYRIEINRLFKYFRDSYEIYLYLP